jgi:anti-sigma regulatory factor (Ser/Thr protein kinase)
MFVTPETNLHGQMLTSRFDKANQNVFRRELAHERSSMDRLLAQTFEATANAPGEARRALDGIDGRLDQEIADDLRLLVSELVTNSLRHTGSARIGLEVWSSADVVRVLVSDYGVGFDVSGPPQPRETSGWGLFMVNRLADRWGVERGDITRVWFEFSRSRAGGNDRRDNVFAAAS